MPNGPTVLGRKGLLACNGMHVPRSPGYAAACMQERNQLRDSVQQARTLVGRLAAERQEAWQKLADANRALGQLREQAAAERRGMWAGLLSALRINEQPLPVPEAAAAVLR